MRRLAQGRLAEIFGSKLIKTDTLFRTLGISRHADQYVANANKNTPAWQAFDNYLSGVNHFQSTGKLPIEFDLLGIKPTAFTLEDSVSVAGYMAYSFAVAMRTEPVMTYIANQLDSEHLELFDLDQANNSGLAINQDTLASLTQLGELSELHQSLGQLEGSNAWAIHGSRTASGKPILESDPHISFSVPGTWYEAHVQTGDFEMYGHHLPLVAPAMLGHNRQFGWGITMFQNDDIDFYLEKTNPDNAKQVWSTDHWQDIQTYPEVIRVKDEADVNIEVRTTRNGPIINDVFDGYSNSQPVSLWWTFTQSDNPMLEAFYGMNHANNIDEFALAVQGIHAPGLNIMYANADNNIGWWAAARIPKRPDHVLPWQILDGASGLDSPQGFYDFKYNPQEVNPDRGYIVSANARQHKYLDFMTPGYYNFPARAEKITEKISALDQATLANQQPIQLDIGSDYAKRALTTMLTTLAESEKSNNPELVQQLQQWDGNFTLSSIAATVFIEWQYQLAEQAFNDELGDDLFGLMKRTRKIDYGFYNILKAPNSPWWNSINNDQVNSMSDVVNNSWETTLTTLSNNLGENWRDWQWQKVHTFELAHALGASKLLRPLFNIGPVPVVGAHAVPNNLSQKFTSGHHSVTAGPSTRRLIDFAQPEKSLGILPAGQSGNPFDRHYKDQFELYTQGQYRPQIMDMDTSSTKSTLTFQP
jgi:penicillin amidase